MNDQIHNDEVRNYEIRADQLADADPNEPLLEIPMPPNVKPKQEIWVRIFDDEETRRREEKLGLDEVQLRAFRKLATFFHLTRYDMSRALPVPPQGSLYLPSYAPLDEQTAKEASVEQVEERVDYCRGEPRFTRVRKRTVPIRKVAPGHPDFEKLWAQEKAEAEQAAIAAAEAAAAREAAAAEEAAALEELQTERMQQIEGTDGTSAEQTPAEDGSTPEPAEDGPGFADANRQPPAERTCAAAAAKSRPGPKPLLDKAMQEQILVHLRVGLSRSVTAAELGVAKSTLSRTIKLNPLFKQRVLQAEAYYEKVRVLCLLKAAKTSWRAGAWMLKHYHPHLSTRRMNRAEEAKYARAAMKQMARAMEQAA